MNTIYLQYVLTIADCRSISKAAQQLTLKQQYLSHVVKSLEDEFNIQIFQRHSRGLSITEDGYVFLNYARQIVNLLDTMHMQYRYPSKQVSRNEKVTLNLHVIPLLYPNLLNKAIATYQGLFTQVKINYVEHYLEDGVPYIMHNPYSVSLHLAKEPLEELENSLPPQLKVVRLCNASLAILTSKQTAKELDIKSMSLQDVLKKDLIAFAPKGVEESAAYQLLSLYGEPNFTLVSENGMIFLNLLAQGNYFTVGTPRIAELNKEIAAIPIQEFAHTSFCNVAIIQETMFTSPIIRDFLNILLQQIGEPTL